ncbi:MAG: PAS domain-containing sensor histidine kinase [Myxococcota bacterium]|nr:PAS domain-containing sensor histidine kinase [Myxococcota bacterium]
MELARGDGSTQPASRKASRADQEAFRRAVDFLGATLDSAPEPVLVVDRAGRVTYANPATTRVLGYAADELEGRPVQEIAPQATRLGSRLADGVARGSVELCRADGEPLWLAVSASPLRLPDGTTAGAVAFLRDESERRREKLRLSRRSDEMEQTIRAVSHDLRSPLVSVLGFSRLLRENFAGGLGERGLHYLHRVEQAGRTMEGLIRELLDFARIGNAGERRALVDPREVLLQLYAELKPRLEEAGVRLEIPPEPPLLYCDRTRLYQIFSNLIGNALEHMGPCDAPRIEVEVAAEGQWHHLIVQDNGRGIEPKLQDHVFEMFSSRQRPDGSRGTGIGLAIVKKIAETHGGRAYVDSRTGDGATFHVTLARP